MRFAPLLAIGLFTLTGVVGRVLYQRLRHGTWGLSLRDPGVLLLAALFLPIAGQAVLALERPDLLAPLALPLPAADALGFAGLAIVVVATGLTVLAQLGMGASWRIGIDRTARPGLVTTGFYAWSRNPIYLFTLVAVAGFVLLVPTWLSLLVLVATWLGARSQALREERWLAEAYGDEFRAWAARVGRFLPGIGRF